ncbi:GNAT family N-acetyltransferase [Patescibacteria group bacterium]|nr:GNAT family N-acetyltransferase [Patescibacteria group bacterium]
MTLVGIFPLTGVVGDAEIRIGGIGGVATLPEFRGKGYMSNLMECSIQKMTEDKYSISILWGDRQRYTNFGKEDC